MNEIQEKLNFINGLGFYIRDSHTQSSISLVATDEKELVEMFDSYAKKFTNESEELIDLRYKVSKLEYRINCQNDILGLK